MCLMLSPSKSIPRVMNYVLNEVMVNALAESRAFQKFAVRSNAAIEELAKKGAQHKETITSGGGDFMRTFGQELTKGFSSGPKRGAS
ncbi:hypothetical protein H632_c2980p0 [Helicosporidium sp. ATCC 50920]|nr:hypothetical protein H632_c2980p0 [Helicosporidium sp. ATCC 50920]|eukprot:KDD72718.1 hypothetical protein H632_c2980p0 [Helicosporidium sp. ATCC 50920]